MLKKQMLSLVMTIGFIAATVAMANPHTDNDCSVYDSFRLPRIPWKIKCPCNFDMEEFERQGNRAIFFILVSERERLDEEGLEYLGKSLTRNLAQRKEMIEEMQEECLRNCLDKNFSSYEGAY